MMNTILDDDNLYVWVMIGMYTPEASALVEAVEASLSAPGDSETRFHFAQTLSDKHFVFTVQVLMRRWLIMALVRMMLH
jgi:nucleoside permease NupC